MIYIGCVENNVDIMRLGRCQVRVVGLHTDNKNLLPTTDLPWFYPIQPITSAAISGIGQSPTGIVNGTWVVIMFRDVECQQGMILGTIAGIPQNETRLTAEEDSITLFTPQAGGSQVTVDHATSTTTVDGQNTVSPDAAPAIDNPPQQFLGPFTEADWIKYKNFIGELESSSVPGGVQNYGTINTLGYAGKYQFGSLAFQDMGYLQAACSNRGLQTTNLWTGKNGLDTFSNYISNGQLQENIMFEYTEKNYRRLLLSAKVINDPTNKAEVSGWLAVCHNGGPGACMQLANGIDTTDGFNTSRRNLFDQGYALFTASNIAPEDLNKDALNTTPVGDQKGDGSGISQGVQSSREANANFGFRDPNTTYPLKKFLNEPDVNRLARGIGQGTIVDIKDRNRDLHVPIANTGDSWDQPKIPFNAKYPHNHVYQSESGHTHEYDDTPGNERIHEYHRTGTFSETDTNGTKVDYIVGDRYVIMNRNGNVHIKGKCNITVDGDCNLLVHSNVNLEVFGKTTANFRGDVAMSVSGKFDLAVRDALRIKAKEILMESASGDMNIKASRNIFVKGNRMDLAGRVQVRSLNLPTGYQVDPLHGIGFPLDASGTGLSTPDSPSTAANPNFPVLNTPDRDLESVAVFESAQEDTDQDSGKILYESIRATGDIPEDKPEKVDATTVPQPNTIKPVPDNCDVINQTLDFPRDFQLSTNFNFKDIVGAQHVLVDQVCGEPGGTERLFTKQEIICNLKMTCINILENILTIKRKSEFVVTSSYRQRGVLPRESMTSDHPKGRAVDIQLSGANRTSAQAHYDFIVQLQQILPYDQILLEYRDTPQGRVVWIHISYNSAKNRQQALTLVNDRTYSQGLVLVS